MESKVTHTRLRYTHIQEIAWHRAYVARSDTNGVIILWMKMACHPNGHMSKYYPDSLWFIQITIHRLKIGCQWMSSGIRSSALQWPSSGLLWQRRIRLYSWNSYTWIEEMTWCWTSYQQYIKRNSINWILERENIYVTTNDHCSLRAIEMHITI